MLFSSKLRTTGRDWREPSGKSARPGTVAPLISLFPMRLNDLLFIRVPATVGTCCTYSFLKPGWQGALFCVCFHLLPRHALEQFVQVYMFTSFNPLARRIDLAVRL